MKRRACFLRLALGAALLAAGGAAGARFRPAERRVVLGDSCHTPARVLEPARSVRGGTVVVFHGLSASAAVMEPIGQSLAAAGWRVYLLDLAGHGRSREPFSYASAEFCAGAALQALVRTGAVHPEQSILLGHSLGAAIAVRLANHLPFAATIAISPALLPSPQRPPPNLLILMGQFDFNAVKQTARALAGLAGGVREGTQDFSERRAVELRQVSWGTHGGMILDPRVWELAIDWSARSRAAMPGASVAASSEGPAANTGDPIAAPILVLLATFAMLAGLALLVAPAETLLGRACGVQPAGAAAGAAEGKALLVWWLLASFFAVSLLGLARAAQWLRPVRMEGGDWAALVALLTGLTLLALARGCLGARGSGSAWQWHRHFCLCASPTCSNPRISPSAPTARLESSAKLTHYEPRALLFAALAAAGIVVAFAAVLNPELVEIPANGARLWRFAILVAFTWPYFAAEEALLGLPAVAGAPPVAGARGPASRMVLFLVLRGVVWLAEAFAVLVFWPCGLLMVLLAVELAIVAIGQRLAVVALRRQGAGVAAAALFDAILAAGTLAVILPLT